LLDSSFLVFRLLAEDLNLEPSETMFVSWNYALLSDYSNGIYSGFLNNEAIIIIIKN